MYGGHWDQHDEHEMSLHAIVEKVFIFIDQNGPHLGAMGVPLDPLGGALGSSWRHFGAHLKVILMYGGTLGAT